MIPGMTEGFSISLSMTKKIGVKGITGTLLATFLLLSIGPIYSVQWGSDICFYSSPFHCGGVSECCTNWSPPRCCQNFNVTFGLSTSVSPYSDAGTSKIYSDNQCHSVQSSSYGYVCLNGNCIRRYDSGKWSHRHDENEFGNEKSCNETVSPDTFEYKFITEDRRRASWVLPMASLGSDRPSPDLPAEDQVIWFTSRGATLKVEDHQTTADPDSTPVPGNNRIKCRRPPGPIKTAG